MTRLPLHYKSPGEKAKKALPTPPVDRLVAYRGIASARGTPPWPLALFEVQYD